MTIPLVPLGDLCDVFSGFAWSAGKFNNDRKGVPIIRIQNVDTEAGSEFVYWNDPYDSRFLVKQGDLLLTLSGSFRIAVWSGPIALLNQRIIRLTPSDQLDRVWLLHVLRPRMKEVERLGRHALVNNVSIADIKQLPIPFPPLSEQRRIAEVLDRAEALRAKRRAALAQLDSLTQAIFNEMFGDPVKNQKQWHTKLLGELGDGPGAIVDGPFGSAISVSEDYIDDGEIPVIRTKNVRPFEFVTQDLKRISRAKFRGLERSAVVPGDILLTKVGTIGHVCIFPPTFEIAVLSTTGSCRIRPNETLVQRTYLAHFLHRYRGQMLRLAAEGVQPFLNMRQIKSFRVPLPPMDLQRKFSVCIDAVEKLKTAQCLSLAYLDTLFASLQHRAFRGEL
jgi:type I restriction enzyme S subunit